MSIDDQDAVLGRLVRERNALKRELAAIDAEIAAYAESVSQMSGELLHNKWSALRTLNSLDLDKLKSLLKGYGEVSGKIQEHSRKITEMGAYPILRGMSVLGVQLSAGKFFPGRDGGKMPVMPTLFRVVRKDKKIMILTPDATEDYPAHEFDDDYKLIACDPNGRNKVVSIADLSDDDLLLALRAAGII